MTATALRYAPQSPDWSGLGLSILCPPMLPAGILGDVFQVDRSQPQPPLQEQLEGALIEAKKAVRQRSSYLGEAETTRLLVKLSELFDPEEWDEDTPVPGPETVHALLRGVLVFDMPLESLTVAAPGNLRALWRVGGWHISLEGLPQGTVAWQMIREGNEDIDRRQGSGSPAEFKAAVAA